MFFFRVHRVDELLPAPEEYSYLPVALRQFGVYLTDGRFVVFVIIEVFYLLQRESHVLELAYGIQPLHLLDGVISVARPLIHFVWNQQSHLFVVAQRLDSHLHQLGELSDF